MKEMKEELKKIECDADCGFLIRSHDENEIKKVVKEHAKMMHHMKMSDEEIEEMMKAA